MLLIMYAKVVEDPELGSVMAGIYFGGMAEDQAEADKIAIHCVSDTQGGTALTKIVKVTPGQDLRKLIRDVERQFDVLADQMYRNEKIIGR
jgi:hypothetical protein